MILRIRNSWVHSIIIHSFRTQVLNFSYQALGAQQSPKLMRSKVSWRGPTAVELARETNDKHSTANRMLIEDNTCYKEWEAGPGVESE